MAETRDDDHAAVAAILAAVAMAGRHRAVVTPPVVIIDGPSGAGKSTLADALSAAWPEAQLLRMDAIVPGWDGLAASSAQLESMLADHRAGRVATWHAWDWAADREGEAGRLDPNRPLVVEGSGSLTARSASFATVAVWVDLDDERERYRRAIDRDGETYAPHWDRWAAQERAHADRHHPRERAGIVVDRAGEPG